MSNVSILQHTFDLHTHTHTHTHTRVLFVTVTKYLLLNEYMLEFPFNVFPARKGIWSLISGLYKFETLNGVVYWCCIQVLHVLSY